MYQALYRKYRPKSFDEIVGQDIIKKIITNEINEGKLSHAYLFCGPRGTGKTSIAKLISKLINCNKQINGVACDCCDSCVEFNNKNYVDIIEIDAASNNGVDEIRELRNKANLLPVSSKYKIYIMDEVHMLSIGAFNALLKTLEEPPKHVIFILATTEVQKIPITIISRCQRFDFNKISENDIYIRLKYISEQENINIDDDALKEISSLTDGGLRDAIGLLDKVIAYTSEKITSDLVHFVNYSLTKNEIEKLFELIYFSKVEEYITFINDINSRGIDLFKVVDELMGYLRDVILNKIHNNYSQTIVLKYINSLNELSNKMKNTSYPKILLETFIIFANSTNENNCAEYKEKKELDVKIENKSIKSSVVEIKQPVIEEKVEETPKEEKAIERRAINTIHELVEVRINNTFANCNKKALTNLKQIWNNIGEYAVTTAYGMAPGMLLDGELVVASENNIIVVYPYSSMAERANNDIPAIEKLLNTVFNKEYKFIALDNNSWNKIKKEYIKNIKNNVGYQLIEEKVDYNKLFDLENEEIVNQALDIFGSDLVQVI